MQIFHYKYVNKERNKGGRKTNDGAAQLSDSPLQGKLGFSKHYLIFFSNVVLYKPDTNFNKLFTDRAMILEHPYLKK